MIQNKWERREQKLDKKKLKQDQKSNRKSLRLHEEKIAKLAGRTI